MGINIEFNLDLALRCYSAFLKGHRKSSECLPKKLESGKTYWFF